MSLSLNMNRGDYKDLIVWKKSMNLVDEIYEVTRGFLREELFGLVSQLRRASCSVVLNIAEGNGKSTNKDYARFLNISFGSCLEVETAVIIGYRQNYILENKYEELLEMIVEIRKILFGLSRSLK